MYQEQRGKLRSLVCLFCVVICLPFHAQTIQVGSPQEEQSAKWRARIEATPKLPFKGVPLVAQAPVPEWASGAVSWVATDGRGEIYEVQRGSEADPVLVLNTQGKVLRSWGRGDFAIPHSIRLDPAGHVWTVDAGSSRVIEYSPAGTKLMSFSLGGLPENGSPFRGATDIAFGPNGSIYITDGYGNARVAEYDGEGRFLRQWGKPGKGPGEFNLPHAIQIAGDGTIYVADRENGRIEEFNLRGRYLREIAGLGRIYSLKLAGDAVWASMGNFDQAPGSGRAWVVKLDRKTGRLLGHIDVPESRAGHDLELMPSGEPVITLGDGLLWFQAAPVVR